MSEKPFTKYLCKLATDAAEIERFRAGPDVARASMAAAGVTDPELQDILLHGEQPAINEVVLSEYSDTDVPPGLTPIAAHILVMAQVQAEPLPDE